MLLVCNKNFFKNQNGELKRIDCHLSVIKLKLILIIETLVDLKKM